MALSKPTSKSKTPSAEKGKDTSKEFFSKMKAKGSILKKAGNEKAPEGGTYTTTEDIIKVFKLKVGGKVSTTAKGTKARMGVDKNGNAYVSFNFVCTGSVGKGQTPSKYINLPMDDDVNLEKSMKTLSATLQRLGYDTKNLTDAKLKELIDAFNEDRPEVSITIERWGDSGINVYVNRVLEEGDAMDDDEEEDVEESEDDDDESSEEDEEEGDDEESESEDDEESEEEDDEDAFDPDDPTTWVGEKASVKTQSMRKAAKMTLLSFNPKTKTFTAKNTKGESVKILVEEVLELE
jgi:hypothetical protein